METPIPISIPPEKPPDTAPDIAVPIPTLGGSPARGDKMPIPLPTIEDLHNEQN